MRISARNTTAAPTVRRTSRLNRSVACSVLALLTAVPVIAAAPAVQAQTANAIVTGRVTAAARDVGLQGAIVRIPELGLETATTRDGSFRLPRVPVGSHELEISYVGAEPVSRRVTVPASGVDLGSLSLTAGGPLEDMLVIGQAAQSAGAINRKRAADIIKDAVTADVIGQFPDQNAAEAARRLPGISVANDQGEGRFIVVRGSDPNLNAISINGVRVPSAENDERQVALDVIPSELLSAVEVNKTVTPDMDGDVIGGSVNIQTQSAFDRDGRFLTGTVEGSYSDLRDKLSPKIAGAASDIFSVGGGEDNLGVALGASWQRRDFASDNVENGEGWDIAERGNNEFHYPLGLEQRDYTVRRERLGVAGNVEYKFEGGSSVYLRGLYSDFKDSENRLANVFELDDGSLTQVDATSMMAEGDYSYEKQSRRRVETQTILTLSAGGSTVFDGLTVDYEGSYSKAREREPIAIEAVFAGGFDEGVQVGVDRRNDPRTPYITTNNWDAIQDSANFELDEMATEDNLTKDEELAARIDLTFENPFGSLPGFIKVGGKQRRREKSNDGNVTIYDGFPDSPTLASGDFATTVDYTLGPVGPMADAQAIQRYLDSGAGDFDVDTDASAIDSQAEDFKIDENVAAGYVMANVDLSPMTIVGGVRVEYTDFLARGHELVENEDEGSLELQPIREQNSYTDILPSMNVRYEATPDIIARAAYSHTLVRPNFEQVAPVNERTISGGEREGSFGNPSLDPYKSQNFDLSLEFYPGDLSIISVAAFYKDIEDYIVTADLAGTPGRFETFDEAITWINGDSATLKGIELNIQRYFDFLPGLLATANYTYADGDADLALGDRKIPLPRQSKHVVNASLGYEVPGVFALRAAVTYRDKYLEALEDLEDPSKDIYVDDHIQLDFTAKVNVTENIELYGKVQNANDRPYYAYYADPAFNAQYETYSWTGSLGLRATY